MNISAFNQMIASRRSIYPRDYKNEKIEDEIIWQILNNAHWAPTHKMTVPWRFKVYAGKGREELGRKQAEIYKKVALEEGNFLTAKYENLAKAPLRASHVIMIIMKRSTSVKIREVEEIAAVGCAVQNIYLTANAYGLGGYWSTGGVTYMEPAKEAFGLAEEDRLMGFFYLGKTDVVMVEGQRPPIEDHVEWMSEI